MPTPAYRCTRCGLNEIEARACRCSRSPCPMALPHPPRRAVHVQCRRFKDSPSGQTATGFGLRLGYWPCLAAPYVQIAFLYWRIDVWHGYWDYDEAALAKQHKDWWKKM